MSDKERRHVLASSLGPEGAATRVWTAKEAAAKALDINLAQAFSRVETTDIQPGKCTLSIDGNVTQALCAEVDGHVFTVLVRRN
jgi:phosphopantetheinyl transferase (holo-ACP synthase)